MKKKSLVTSIGSLVLDVLYYTDEGMVIQNRGDVTRQELIAFEKAAKISAKDAFVAFGGGAANTSCTFASFGLRPRILTAVGIDALGKECIQNLASRGVDTRLVQIIDDARTGMSFIVTTGEKCDHVVFVFRGASSHLQLTPSIVKKIRTPWVYITSQSGYWRKNLSLLFAHAAKKKIHSAWNPGAEQLKGGMKALKKFILQTDILLLNKDEAIELSLSAGYKSKRPQPKALARYLYTFGSKYVVITDGHKGAYAFDGKTSFYQKAKLGKVENKTGAGDAFGSAFVAGMIQNYDVQRAMKLAAYNSYSVVSKLGAQNGILTLSQIRKMKL